MFAATAKNQIIVIWGKRVERPFVKNILRVLVVS